MGGKGRSASEMRRAGTGEVNMAGWWWIPIGVGAWFAVATAVALWLGPVLRSCSQARETLDKLGKP
jgi:hypothetical protein